MSPPLSRPLVVATVPPDGERVEVVADAAERAALAAVNEVESVESLTAAFEVRQAGRDGLAVRGVLEARATRMCVVTLEPFVETVREEIELRFAPQAAAAGGEESEDPPDPIIGGAVDLGAVAAEYFTLGLDPHPRKPGAAFDSSVDDDAEASPFAALGALKPRNGGEA